MGSSVSKAAIGATTDERAEPESKHLADLTRYINETNRSVKHLADVLFEKTGNGSWVVVFKALITVHHLMVYGNERFIRHLASRNSLFTLHNFLDRSFIDGNAMSIFIRQYSRYLNEKSLAYRLIASDITKSKRGANGMMRTMDTNDLLNILPVIQTQFDALLKFDANPDEISNGIIHAAFRLLFKDCLRLFAAYNEGILNLLVGIQQNGIPYLAQAPHGLIEALKQHLDSLEEKNDILLSNGVQHAWIPSISNGPVVNALPETDLFAAHAAVGAGWERKTTIADNLDSSLTSLVGNLNFGQVPVNKFDMKWRQPSEMEITDGMNWELSTCTCTSTIWSSISISPIPYTVTPPETCPATSQQMPVYRMVSTPKGAPSLM
ncbi:phosphatidylinositol-binding clathrin assembly protein-like [Pteropus medius]|uniref:phosphatidylinositol-binding clathrin assembly protein-like n=1 Tax=Pteropus vampyrus TaxID=132908 RepID=UPI00196ADDEC|nr:phosphatidylinositol-binding clathrin assembly protein-like [Pteropus giganteus]